MLPGPSSSSSKRKVDMLTEELSLSRMKLAKMSRASTLLRKEEVPIEIPDFPMEFYHVTEQAQITKTPGTSLQDWFDNFTKHPTIMKQPQAYHDWVHARTLDLLPKVLTVICKNLNPFHPFRITAKDSLSCRLVSKSWKETIDKFLHDSVLLESIWPIISFLSQRETLIKVATCIRSYNYQQVLEMLYFLDKNKDLQTLTPFPSGRLFLWYVPQVENRYEMAFNNALEILLEFHGATLQSFTFHDNRQKPDIPLMFRWLKKMPNLKALEICTSQSTCSSYRIPRDFPRLPKLITFVGKEVPSELIEKMLRLNPQIRNLRVEGCEPQWSKLKELSLTSLSLQVSSVTQLQSLGALQLPLQMLRLNSWIGDAIELDEVFQFLRGYEGTLKELHLFLEVTDSTNISSLKLPRLQHLDLTLIPSSRMKISFDFLLPLEFLQSLKIDFVNGEENQHEADVSQVIQLHGYFHRMYESNLWKLFPNLKRLYIDRRFTEVNSMFYVYTRDKLPSERRIGDDP